MFKNSLINDIYTIYVTLFQIEHEIEKFKQDYAVISKETDSLVQMIKNQGKIHFQNNILLLKKDKTKHYITPHL